MHPVYQGVYWTFSVFLLLTLYQGNITKKLLEPLCLHSQQFLEVYIMPRQSLVNNWLLQGHENPPSLFLTMANTEAQCIPWSYSKRSECGFNWNKTFTGLLPIFSLGSLILIKIFAWNIYLINPTHTNLHLGTCF